MCNQCFVKTFRRNMLLTSRWRQRQEIPPQCQISARMHGVISQKPIYFNKILIYCLLSIDDLWSIQTGNTRSRPDQTRPDQASHTDKTDCILSQSTRHTRWLGCCRSFPFTVESLNKYFTIQSLDRQLHRKSFTFIEVFLHSFVQSSKYNDLCVRRLQNNMTSVPE